MSERQQIDHSRKEIDRLDDEILKILNERSQHVITIGKAKRKADPTALLHTPGRESAIIERLTKANTGPFPNDAIRPLYREIMSASLSLEGMQTIAYLGPPATFTHIAALGKFGESAQYVPVSGIKEVFDEVERGRAIYGVVPIENSTEGVVNYTLDMFIDSNLMIYGEVMQEVSHHLMSKAHSIDEITKVYSHPQALAQCRNWLDTHLPNVATVETPSTSRAAERCAEEPTSAAIAAELAANLYGLQILKSRIEDNINNFTRFLVLCKHASDPTGKDKTSIMLSVKDKSGALYDLLRPFASNGINMTKIESRPSRRKAWEYIFFVDVEGHKDDDRIRRTIDEIKPRCLFLKILGSYPMHT
ncbi:MAG: prephenate dehydratase [Nitrospirae bacterium]|nr:prephenate dehydratase [Nitrospirota bacterium]MDA1304581.1 prephenate dehydratase [Nitrospirota bacterium]